METSEENVFKCSLCPKYFHFHLFSAFFLYLRSPCDHVLDEVPVARSVDNGDVVLAGLKLPKGDVNGDATLTLCLQLVQNPGIFKGTLSHLGVHRRG